MDYHRKLVARSLMRGRLAEAQNHRCAYCGFRMVDADNLPKGTWATTWARRAWLKAMRARRVTFEHFVPKTDRGPDTWWNAIAACEWCNTFRGNAPAPDAYRKIRELLSAGQHPHQVWDREHRWSPVPHIAPRLVERRGRRFYVVMEGGGFYFAEDAQRASIRAVKATVEAMRRVAMLHGLRLRLVAIIFGSRRLDEWAEAKRVLVHVTHPEPSPEFFSMEGF